MYETYVRIVLGIVAAYLALRLVSMCWVPRFGYYNTAPLVLVLLTLPVVSWWPTFDPNNMQDPRGILIVLVLCGWAGTPLWLGNLMDKIGDGKPRIGYLYSFWRRQFFTAYQPGKDAPFGRLVQCLGLSHFQSGFMMCHAEWPGCNGQKVDATLVVKMNAVTNPRMFGRAWEEIHTNFHSLGEEVAQGSGNQTHRFLAFGQNRQDVIIEVQKVKYYPSPVAATAAEATS